MLIACPDCRLQYDVSDMTEGSQVRCRCDTLITVTAQTPHEPRAARCSGCGGPLSPDKTRCEYCGDSVVLEELRLGAVCPECFARTAKDGKFCIECGIEIRPQSLAPLPADTGCPRCQAALRSRALGDTSVIECVSCAGLWLRPAVFEELCARAEQGRTDLPGESGSAPDGITAQQSMVTYLPCVVCDDFMVRRNFGGNSGVIIDVCRRHGVWLDHSELEKVLAHVRAGGLQQARRREMLDAESRMRRARAEASTPQMGNTMLLTEQHRGPDLGDAVRWLGGMVRGLF